MAVNNLEPDRPGASDHGYEVIDISARFGARPSEGRAWTVDDVLERSTRKGVDRMFALSDVGIFSDFVEGNPLSLEAAEKHARLEPVVTINPIRYFHCEDQIERAVEAGVRLFRFFPVSQHGWSTHEPTFRRLASLLAGQNIALMIENERRPGSMTETARALGELDINLIFQEAPYWNTGGAITLMKNDPRTHVESHGFNQPDSIEVIASEVGSDRIIFGTGGPPANVRAALNAVLHANVPEGDRRLILAGNAKRLLLDAETDDRPSNEVTGSPFGAPVRGPDTAPIFDVHVHSGVWQFPFSGHGIGNVRKLMQKYNYEVSVVSSAKAITNDFETGNRELVEDTRGAGDILVYVVVNPNDIAGSLEELDRHYPEPHVAGAKIHPGYNTIPTGERRTRELVREVAARGKPLLLHTWGHEQIDGTVGLAKETPEATIIMAHGGGDEWRCALLAARPCANVVFEFCGAVPEDNQLSEAIRHVGVDRVLFGSDMDMVTPAWMIGIAESDDLTDDQLNAILHGNARRLFGVES